MFALSNVVVCVDDELGCADEAHAHDGIDADIVADCKFDACGRPIVS